MYDVKALEEQWKQYNRNKKKPYFVAALIVAVFGLFFVMYSFKSNIFSSSSVVEPGISLNSLPHGKSFVLLNDSIQMIQEQEKAEIVKPEVKVALEDTMVNDVPTLPVVDNIPVLDEKPRSKSVKSKPKIRVSEKKDVVKKPRKKMHLNIVESSSVSAYKDVEKRFYQSHDMDDSLFLAKSYYRKGNYKKSEYWSLQTNKVNSNIEESWIIFAKSKVKLGRKNEAIRVLTNYVKRSNSSAATNLLHTLQKN